MTRPSQETVLLSWGAKPLPVDISGRRAEVLALAGEDPWLTDPHQALLDALDSPEKMDSFGQWVAGARRVVVVLGSPGWIQPWPRLLSTVLENVEAAGVDRASITVIDASRIEPSAENAESLSDLGEVGRSPIASVAGGLLGEMVRVVGGQVPSTARMSSSATATRRRLVRLDTRIMEADRIIAIETVVPHPVLGYSGAGCALVPDMADAPTAEALIDLGVNPVCGAGRIEGNPARQIVHEALQHLGDRVMCVDVIGLEPSRIGGFAVGRPSRVASVAAPLARRVFGVVCKPSRCVIASAPAPDLESLVLAGAVAVTAVRSTGSLLLVGQCPEGPGTGTNLTRLVENVLLPRISRGHVMVYTSLEPREVLRYGLRPVRGVGIGLDVMGEHAGDDDSVTVIPDCSVSMPVL